MEGINDMDNDQDIVIEEVRSEEVQLAAATEYAEKWIAERREMILASDASEEVKAFTLGELDKMTEEVKDPEVIKIALQEAAAPRKFYSTNLMPYNVAFKLPMSETGYIRTKQGLRRCDVESNIINRPRGRKLSNTAKSILGQQKRAARLKANKGK